MGPLSLIAAAGCSTGGSGLVCTANFAYFGVTVVDSANQPILATWAVSDTVVRTGKALSIDQIGPASSYPTIFSDNNLHDVREAGDVVHVTGNGGGKRFAGSYQFGSAGGCHVQRVSGPDTVVAH